MISNTPLLDLTTGPYQTAVAAARYPLPDELLIAFAISRSRRPHKDPRAQHEQLENCSPASVANYGVVLILCERDVMCYRHLFLHTHTRAHTLKDLLNSR